MNLQTVPLWLLVLLCVLSFGCLIAVLFWIMPPHLRFGSGGGSLLAAVLFFVFSTATRQDPRGSIWFGIIGPWTAIGPLLWLGRLPEDMPSARDPRVVDHPQYAAIRLRGLRAGAVVMFLLFIAIALTGIYVRGL